MLEESLKDACQILQTILNQPLSVEGASPNVSLLSAAQDFKEKEASFSDLSKVLYSFLQYPEATETLLKELQLIAKELSSFMNHPRT
ncbi:MAG: hypothetical protein ACM3JI_03935 [Anaerolineae bacterium]